MTAPAWLRDLARTVAREMDETMSEPAKAWRINPRDEYGQISLGDMSAAGAYVVVAVPKGMSDEYAARLMAHAELLAEACGSAELCISNHSDDGELCANCRAILDQIQAARTEALGHELAITQILEHREPRREDGWLP